MSIFVSVSADVAGSAVIGVDSRVWHLAQICEKAVVGESCVVGRGAYVGPGVRVGDRCKIQNYALVYAPATLGSGVFIGPGAILTNDHNPRSIDVAGEPKSADDWAPVGVHIREGASLGAGVVCVAPLTIGRWAMVGAGAVVIDDVPDFALVVGSPARRIGWVGPAGIRLEKDDESVWRCPRTGARFIEEEGRLHESRH